MTKSSEIFFSYLSSIATLSRHSQYKRERSISRYAQFLQQRSKTLLTATLTDLIAYAEFKVENKNEKLRIERISFKTYLKYILYFYEFAADEGHYSAIEVKRLRKYVENFKFEIGEEKTRLSKEQITQLLEETNCHSSLKIATLTLLNFGFRISEILNLKVQDIDFEKELITIHKGKGRKTRRIPILEYQLSALKQMLQMRQKMLPLNSTEDHFLINKNTGRKVSKAWLQDYYVRITKRLDFRVHAHRLRRTFASILFFDLGIDIYLIAWLLGHSSIQTTLIYLGIKEKEKQQAYKKAMKGKTIVSFS
ncbi:MAG TPA: tyrosine-type recombinase/integrase [Candidatus Bathyarchaeia archaeon]|nr:tyrosine-type recombinase/integrase [Candidatus Bathyarchaeia archaeon]